MGVLLRLRWRSLTCAAFRKNPTSHEEPLRNLWTTGPDEVGRLIKARDSRFEKYLDNNQVPSETVRLQSSSELVDMIRQSRSIIDAHKSDEAREIDPQGSGSIGGHIHIATITPIEGFKWVPGFEPKSTEE